MLEFLNDIQNSCRAHLESQTLVKCTPKSLVSIDQIIQWLKLHFTETRITLSLDHLFTVDCQEHLCNAKINFKFTGEFDERFAEEIHKAYACAKENIVNFMDGVEVIDQHEICSTISEFSIMLHV